MRAAGYLLVVVLSAQGCRKTTVREVVRPAPSRSAAPARQKPAQEPPPPRGPLDLAERHHQAGRHKQAEVLLLRLINTAQPRKLWERMKAREHLGRIYLEQRRFSDAEKVLSAAARDFEVLNRRQAYTVACPYQALGVLYAHMGKQSRAASYFIKAARLEPHSEKMQYDAALESMVAGDFTTALKHVDRAIALSRRPQAAAGGDARDLPHRYLVLKGFIWLPMRKYSQARRLFGKVLAKVPGDPGALAGLGHLDVVHKRYRSATSRLERALQGARKMLNEKRGAVGPSPGAQDPAERLDAMRNPTRIYSWLSLRMACLGLGWVAANQNRHKQAIGYFERTLTHRPADLLALLGKGNSLTALGQLDRAERLFARLRTLYPDNPYVLAEGALVQFNKRNDRRAERGFKKAIQLDKEYTCPYEGLGLIYLRRGQLARAKASFQRAISLNPDIEFKKYNGLARIYIKEGRVDEARRLLQKSVANYPHDSEARRLLAALEKKGKRSR